MLKLQERLQQSAGPGLAETPAHHHSRRPQRTLWLVEARLVFDYRCAAAAWGGRGLSLYPPQHPPKHPALPAGPNTTELSKAGPRCLHLSKGTRSRMLQGPTPKHLSGLSWVQARSAQHGSAAREAPERVSTQRS